MRMKKKEKKKRAELLQRNEEYYSAGVDDRPPLFSDADSPIRSSNIWARHTHRVHTVTGASRLFLVERAADNSRELSAC